MTTPDIDVDIFDLDKEVEMLAAHYKPFVFSLAGKQYTLPDVVSLSLRDAGEFDGGDPLAVVERLSSPEAAAALAKLPTAALAALFTRWQAEGYDPEREKALA